MNLHLHARLTVADYADASILHLRKAMMIVVAIAFLISMGLTLYLFSGMGKYERILMPIVTALAFLIIFIFRNEGLAKQAERLFFQRKDLQRPYEIFITETELHVTSDNGNGRAAWSDFHKWSANEKVALLYISEGMYHLFPRHFFSSDSEFEAFKDFLKTKIGPMGKARRT